VSDIAHVSRDGAVSVRILQPNVKKFLLSHIKSKIRLSAKSGARTVVFLPCDPICNWRNDEKIDYINLNTNNYVCMSDDNILMAYIKECWSLVQRTFKDKHNICFVEIEGLDFEDFYETVEKIHGKDFTDRQHFVKKTIFECNVKYFHDMVVKKAIPDYFLTEVETTLIKRGINAHS
jgi:hypothetical protein